MGTPRHYRVALAGDWKLRTFDADGDGEIIRAKKGDIFTCHGRKDYSQTRGFDLVDVDDDYLAVYRRWSRIDKTPERFKGLSQQNHNEARSLVADLCAGTKYAPVSQSRENLLAFVTALHNLQPLPSKDDDGDDAE